MFYLGIILLFVKKFQVSKHVYLKEEPLYYCTFKENIALTTAIYARIA